MVAISAVVTGAAPPAVSVTVSAPPAGLVTVDRGVAGVFTPVRGAESVTSTNPMTVVDYEAPTGTSLTYRVYPVGNPGTATTSSALSVPNGTCVWLVSLTQPVAASVRPAMRSESPYTVPTLTSVVYPLPGASGVSSPVTAIAGSGTRQGTVEFRTFTATEEAEMLALMGQVVWVSHDPTHGFGPFYAVFTNPKVDRIAADVDDTGRVIEADYQVVDRPTVTSSGVVTWLDVAGRFTTWNDLAAAYTTWDQFLADSSTWSS